MLFRSVSQTTYSDLYAVIGCNFGCSGGNFNLPDFRGRFLRGRDGSSGRDPDSGSRTAMNTGGNTADNVGSVQVDAFQGHWHDVEVSGGLGNYASGIFGAVNNNAGGFSNVGSYYRAANIISNGTNGTPRITSETRPVNASVNWIVKY